jgi:hypothetical protein
MKNRQMSSNRLADWIFLCRFASLKNQPKPHSPFGLPLAASRQDEAICLSKTALPRI